MNLQQTQIAENCIKGSYAGTIDFPTVLNTLSKSGFEGYFVDFRRSATTCYLISGDNVEIQNPKTAGMVAATFNARDVEANVRKSQAGAHTYREFCENVKNAGCAGYLVTLLGRRVVYFGRNGETHVEVIPAAVASH